MSEENMNDEKWKKILESIFGADKADEMFSRMKNSGFDPAEIANVPLPNSPFELDFLVNQVKNMLSDSSGPINWKMAQEVALKDLKNTQPVLTQASNTVKESLRAADLWLDSVTSLPPSLANYQAWTQKEWVENTLEHWKILFDPVATNYSKAISTNLMGPESEDNEGTGYMFLSPDSSSEFSSIEDLMKNKENLMFSGSPKDVMNKMFSTLFGFKVGGAFSKIAKNVFGSNDIGLQLTTKPTTALVVENIKEFAEELNVPFELATQYLAIIECAYARLFTSVPWLVSSIENAVEKYASHIQIDLDSIRSMMEDMGPISISSMEPDSFLHFMKMESSPEQKQAQENLEFLLAITQGWVEEVTTNVLLVHLPEALPLREMLQRRRVTQGPTEYAFKQLVDIDLSPKLIREARNLWAFILKETNIEERDHYWSHPDIAPRNEDLEDVTRFFEYRQAQALQDEKIDSDLQKLLDGTLGYIDGLDPNQDSEGDQKIK